MKRMATIVVLLAALALVAVAAAAVSEDATSTAPATKAGSAATTLTVWVGWSARELSEFKKVAAEYDKKNAAVTVKVVGGINDDKIIAALRGGNAPDVVSSFTSANVGIYCPSGGWVDLGPYLKRDKVDMNQFPAATLYYTQYKGKRCALPLLADVYGFYYNKTLLAAAGLKAPPKTLTELTAYAKKLTKKEPAGPVPRRDQRLGLGRVHDHRLLEEDVDAGLQAGRRLGGVEDVRGDDEDDIEFRGEPLDEARPVGFVRGCRQADPAELGGGQLERGLGRLATRDDDRVLAREHGPEVAAGHRAHADDANANRVSRHIRSLSKRAGADRSVSQARAGVVLSA